MPTKIARADRATSPADPIQHAMVCSCPFCGRQTGLRACDVWRAVSDDPSVEPHELEEWQCVEGCYRSFWLPLSNQQPTQTSPADPIRHAMVCGSSPHHWPPHERNVRWMITSMLLLNPCDRDLWDSMDGEVQSC